MDGRVFISKLIKKKKNQTNEVSLNAAVGAYNGNSVFIVVCCCCCCFNVFFVFAYLVALNVVEEPGGGVGRLVNCMYYSLIVRITRLLYVLLVNCMYCSFIVCITR